MKSLAVLICLMGSATGWAAPLNFEVSMTGGTESASHPLAGATIKLRASWDPSTLTPLSVLPGRVVWPTTNTTMTLDVTGSAGHDGQYLGTIPTSPTIGWLYYNNGTLGDAFFFPPVGFPIGSPGVFLNSAPDALAGIFDANHFIGDTLPVPGPFSASEVTWTAATLNLQSAPGGVRITANNISGFATQVPEPTCFALAAAAVAALTVTRRRK